MSCGICRWQKFLLLLQVYYFQGRTTKAVEWSGGAQLQTKSLNKNVMFRKNKDKLINCLLRDHDYYESYLENQMAGSIPYHEHCSLCVPTWGFVFKPWPHEKKRSLSKAADGWMDGLTRSLSVARHICDSSSVTEALVEARLAICCCC
jgi:hypothetical protein